jgi:hypothetical protein
VMVSVFESLQALEQPTTERVIHLV